MNNKRFYLSSIATSAMASLSAVFLLPQFLNAYMSPATKSIQPIYAVLASASVVVLFCLTAFLICTKRKGKPSYGKALGRTALLLLIFAVGAIFIGLVTGLVAVLIHAMLKNILSFDQIKGVVDVASAFVTLAAAPLFVSVFWSETYNGGSVWKALTGGLKVGGKRYLKLLILLLILLGLGFFAAFLVNNEGIAGKITAIVLMTTTGTAGIVCSDKLWTNK